MVPTAIVCDAGLTVMDTIMALVTVNGVDPVTVPRVALMVVVPGVSPLELPPLTICNTAVLEDAQVTCRVRF